MKLDNQHALPPGWGLASLRAGIRDLDQVWISDAMLPTTAGMIGVAPWKFCLTHEGEWIASFFVVPDPPDRGVVCMLIGRAAYDLNWRRPGLIREARAHFLNVRHAFRELRAWVRVDDEKAEAFAKWFGFRLDCGPATGIAPDGADANLMLWRREWAAAEQR